MDLDKKITVMGSFPEEVCRYYFKELLDGLDYLHKNGIAHRDIKPENILFDSECTLKIADFGASTKFDENGRI